jgi:hypothetical protein
MRMQAAMIAQVMIGGRRTGLSSWMGSIPGNRIAARLGRVSSLVMAQDDLFKRLLDAGAEFASQARARGEELVRDLGRLAEGKGENAQSTVEDLIERTRRNTEQLVDTLREQAQNLGLIPKDEPERKDEPEGPAPRTTAAPAEPAKKATKTTKAAKAAKATKTTKKVTKAAKASKAARTAKATAPAGARKAAKPATKSTPAAKAAKSGGATKVAKASKPAKKASGPAKKASGPAKKAGEGPGA